MTEQKECEYCDGSGLIWDWECVGICNDFNDLANYLDYASMTCKLANCDCCGCHRRVCEPCDCDKSKLPLGVDHE